MKSKFLFIVLVIVTNCSTQEVSIYNNFQRKFDSLFYNGDSNSVYRLNKIYKAIDVAGNNYYSKEFHDSINTIETYYKDFISQPDFSEIWRIDTIKYRRRDKKPVPYLIINDEFDQYFNILKSAVKKDTTLWWYKESYIAIGTIPTNIDCLNIIKNLNLKDEELRLIFYLHIVTWFSLYSETIPN